MFDCSLYNNKYLKLLKVKFDTFVFIYLMYFVLFSIFNFGYDE